MSCDRCNDSGFYTGLDGTPPYVDRNAVAICVCAAGVWFRDSLSRLAKPDTSSAASAESLADAADRVLREGTTLGEQSKLVYEVLRPALAAFRGVSLDVMPGPGTRAPQAQDSVTDQIRAWLKNACMLPLDRQILLDILDGKYGATPPVQSHSLDVMFNQCHDTRCKHRYPHMIGSDYCDLAVTYTLKKAPTP